MPLGTQEKHHGLQLRDRALLELTGVTKVESFDDHEIAVWTELGLLTVKGENLHIRHLDLEAGDLRVDGEVAWLGYAASRGRKGGLSRLFK